MKANEFLILKRKTRMLTKAEVAFLFRAEKIPQRNNQLYYDMMLSGPAEIIVVSKISAVSDCHTIFNGANPFGRRRINYLNEDKPNFIRKNVDSVDAMFEIAPFTCFSEFIDLEDFLIRNSRIDKFRRLGPGPLSKKEEQKFDKTAELLYATKLKEIKNEVNLLQRHFNVVGYTPSTLEDASRELCIFSPQIASIQEVCLILNPMYNENIDAAFEVLVRSNFTILQHSVQQLTELQAEKLTRPKYVDHCEPVVDVLVSAPVNVFHLAKIAGDREMRALFHQSDLEYEDLFCPTMWPLPYKPHQIPYLFFFMDTERSFELCLSLMYK